MKTITDSHKRAITFSWQSQYHTGLQWIWRSCTLVLGYIWLWLVMPKCLYFLLWSIVYICIPVYIVASKLPRDRLRVPFGDCWLSLQKIFPLNISIFCILQLLERLHFHYCCVQYPWVAWGCVFLTACYPPSTSMLSATCLGFSYSISLSPFVTLVVSITYKLISSDTGLYSSNTPSLIIPISQTCPRAQEKLRHTIPTSSQPLQFCLVWHSVAEWPNSTSLYKDRNGALSSKEGVETEE